MARSLTVRNIKDKIEHLFGRQSEAYILRLVNDALLDLASKKQHYSVSATTNLEEKKRWYTLDDSVIDITKVEILDTNDRYVRVPKLAAPHKLLREDRDEADD